MDSMIFHIEDTSDEMTSVGLLLIKHQYQQFYSVCTICKRVFCLMLIVVHLNCSFACSCEEHYQQIFL